MTAKFANYRILTGLVAWVAAISSPAALASPVQVMECQVVFLDQPVPELESVYPKFIIRRHIEQVAPYSDISNDFWAQGKFENNGYFDVTVYPSVGDPPQPGDPRVERSLTTHTEVLDGKMNFGDSYIDEATSMNKTVSIDGWTLDSVTIILRRADGDFLDTHTTVPEVIDRAGWDPYGGCGEAGCPVECVVTWHAPGEGIPCAVGSSGGGTGLCPTGSYIGLLSNISYEEHEAEHASAFVINAGLNDAWISEGAPFQGLFVTVYPELGLVFVSWFTFDVPGVEAATTIQSVKSAAAATFGADGQRWVTAVGPYAGNQATLNMELTSGGTFNSSVPLPTQDTEYGTMTLDFSDCANGTVTFNVPSKELSGTFPINRVVDSNVALCEALSSP